MQKFYKLFDYFFNAIPVSVVLTCALIVVLGMSGYNFPSTFFENITATISVALLFLLIFGLLSVLIGLILLILNWKKKNAKQFSSGKRMIVKGIVRSVVAVVLLVLLSFAESYFGLALPGTHMPKILDTEITDNFPVKDLQIITFKNIPPQISGDSWSCDVTVHNTNTKMNAINLSFKGASEKDNDDEISPGETKIIGVYPDDNSQTPCQNVSIMSAQIIKYSNK